jgi:guanyl-specific ribonuclease Sa
MSLEEIKSGLAGLPQEQQDYLAAYLVHLRHQRDAGTRREITARIDDQNPDHWVSLGGLKEKWEG